jgi:hypothetical protein
MKPARSFFDLKLLLLAILLSGSNSLRSSVCNSEIQDVTIGGTIAEVSRKFSVKDIPAGAQSIVVEHLPNTIDENSIEVLGKGNAEVVSTVIQNQIVYRDTDPDFATRVTQINHVIKEIAQLTHTVQLQQELTKARWSAVTAYVNDVVNRNTVKATPVPLDQLTQVLDYQEKEQRATHEKQAALHALSTTAADWAAAAQEMLTALKESGQYANLLSGAHKPPSSEAIAALTPQLTAVFDLVSALPKTAESWPASKQMKELHINLHVPQTPSAPAGNRVRPPFCYNNGLLPL